VVYFQKISFVVLSQNALEPLLPAGWGLVTP